MNQLARQRRHATEDRGEDAQRFVLRLLGQFQDVTWRAHKRIARKRKRKKKKWEYYCWLCWGIVAKFNHSIVGLALGTRQFTLPPS